MCVCVRTMHVADLGMHRQKYATEAQLNHSHAVLIVHPIKSRGAESDARRLPWLLDSWRHMWSYLRRAPAVARPLAEARVHFRFNDSRPLVERVPSNALEFMAASGRRQRRA